MIAQSQQPLERTAGPRILIEVSVDSVASASAAERGGAARIELCSALSVGGLTPSAGLVEKVRSALSIPIHLMIRPRPGDFYYDRDEFETMQRDICVAKQMGAHGVVIGLLDVDGSVDVSRTKELVDLARPLEVTFHRAFDMSADLFRALEDVCACGANRLLTSGGKQTCLEGQATIAELIQRADERIIVMPGSGIKPENARALVENTGAREIHAGLRTVVPSPMHYRNEQVAMGSAASGEYERSVVTEESVKRLCDALSF